MSTMSAQEVLEREFLEIRAKILELAASLDRLDRASGTVTSDARYARIQQGVSVLLEDEPGRAERVQLLFSRSYEDNWRDSLGI
jgi:hypothetical protein